MASLAIFRQGAVVWTPLQSEIGQVCLLPTIAFTVLR